MPQASPANTQEKLTHAQEHPQARTDLSHSNDGSSEGIALQPTIYWPAEIRQARILPIKDSSHSI
jgi:hypothetical protein